MTLGQHGHWRVPQFHRVFEFWGHMETWWGIKLSAVYFWKCKGSAVIIHSMVCWSKGLTSDLSENLSLSCRHADACSLKSDTGGCWNYIIMWFFDSKQRRCSPFWYGGCGGNANRFETEEECKNLCLSPTGIRQYQWRKSMFSTKHGKPASPRIKPGVVTDESVLAQLTRKLKHLEKTVPKLSSLLIKSFLSKRVWIYFVNMQFLFSVDYFFVSLTDFVLYSILVLYLSNALKRILRSGAICSWAAIFLFMIESFFFHSFKNDLCHFYISQTNIWERCSIDWWESKDVILSLNQILTYYLNKKVSVCSI